MRRGERKSRPGGGGSDQSLAAHDLGFLYRKSAKSASVVGITTSGDKLAVWCWSPTENLRDLGVHDPACARGIAREAMLAAPGATLFVQNAAIELQRRRTSI